MDMRISYCMPGCCVSFRCHHNIRAHEEETTISLVVFSISKRNDIHTKHTLKSYNFCGCSSNDKSVKMAFLERRQTKRFMDIDFSHATSQGPSGAVKSILRMRLSAVVATMVALSSKEKRFTVWDFAQLYKPVRLLSNLKTFSLHYSLK